MRRQRPLLIQPVLCLGLLALSFCLVLSSCGDKSQNGSSPSNLGSRNWDQDRAQEAYELMQAELQLTRSDSVYMVMDFARKALQLRVRGTVVWDYPIELVDGGVSDLKKFYRRFRSGGKYIVRPITGKHLFASRHKMLDSILVIVGKVVNVDPETLQREIPEHFQLQWGDGVMLDISTNIRGEPISSFKNTLLGVGQTLQKPFGEARLDVKMDTARAITFYRVTEIGLPTLVYPPDTFLIQEKENPKKKRESK
jgi:hypothetical protein